MIVFFLRGEVNLTHLLYWSRFAFPYVVFCVFYVKLTFLYGTIRDDAHKLNHVGLVRDIVFCKSLQCIIACKLSLFLKPYLHILHISCVYFCISSYIYNSKCDYNSIMIPILTYTAVSDSLRVSNTGRTKDPCSLVTWSCQRKKPNLSQILSSGHSLYLRYD